MPRVGERVKLRTSLRAPASVADVLAVTDNYAILKLAHLTVNKKRKVRIRDIRPLRGAQ